MSLLFLVVLAIFCLFLGYFFYGFFISRLLRLNNNNPTPASKFSNNSDFVPTNKVYLLGQHLSAIAAAGPIVGPILAAMWFGWVPTILWIILGGIFIGGVHDMAAIVASLRHQGKSIAEVIRENMSKRAYILFLLFLWFSIIYVVTAFTDITASTFADEKTGAAVASSSMLYLMLALGMGITLRRFKLPLLLSSLIFLPLVFLCIHLGALYPLRLSPILGLDIRTTWDILLLIYCFFASVIPVWLLLQPRGYLGGFFLTFTAGISFIGLAVGSFTQKFLVQFPAFTNWVNPQGLPLLPILFTTVACGACSGFHAIVSSGTTSKQIAKETDARFVGYGGMLLESFVAIIALGTLLILNSSQAQALKDPNLVFAHGMSVFLGSLGINKEFALNFALLAFATFVYDTLDVATRLGRYILQELAGWRGKFSPYAATLVTLLLPFIFVTRRITDAQGNPVAAWRVFWTVFGSSNQLLASLVLLGISVWLFKKRMKYLISLIPSFFMMLIAVVSLFLLINPWLINLLKGKIAFDALGITSSILLLLTFLLFIEGIKIFSRARQK
jgi:carbon starvation protein